MNREIRLDKHLIDVDPTDIPTIIFNNPIFFDLSNIKANRTTTYRIPLTANNLRVVKALGKVNASSAFARDYHTLTEIRDGLTIIPNARARVVGTSPEHIEFSVVWGALKSIADELGQISIKDFEEIYLDWNDQTTFIRDTSYNNIGFLFFRTIQNLPEKDDRLKDMRYHFPSVRFDYLLDRIIARVDSPVTFPYDFRENVRKLWLPVTNSQPDEASIYNEDTATTVTMYRRDGILNQWRDNEAVWLPYVSMVRNNMGAFVPVTDNLGWLALPVGSYRLRLTISWTDGANAGRTLIAAVTWFNDEARDRVEHRVTLDRAGRVANDVATVEFEITSPEWGGRNNNMSKVFIQFWYDEIEPFVESIDYDVTRVTPPIVDVTADIWTVQSEIPFGSKFPVIANLPEITGLDFIKNLMFIFGLYARVNANGVTEFKYIDSLLDGFETARNIEAFIIDTKPETLKYTYGDYAQRNEYRFAEDDTQTNNGDGVIRIADRTLDETKEVVRLLYAPSDDNGSALVPLWVRTVDLEGEETLTFQGDKIKPRLLTAYTPDNDTTLTFTGTFSDSIKFPGILSQRYKLMQNILKDPKVIEIRLVMSVAMLHEFNDTDIFFFWGSYWLQVQTTANGDGTANGQFIEITRY